MIDFQNPSLKQRIVFFAIAMTVYGVLVYWFRFIVIDDPYISFRYAKNLVEGNGLVFNPGERVEGYSNLTWVLNSAFFIALGFKDPLFSMQMASFMIMTMLIALFCFGLPKKVSNDDDKPWGLNPAAGILVAASYPIAVWTAGALETVAYSVLLFLSAMFTARVATKPDRVFSIFLVILIVMTTMTRPEGAMVFGLPMIAFLLRPQSEAKRTLLIVFVISLLLVLTYTIWRHIYFGTIVPNTVSAKVGGSILGAIKRGLIYGWEYANGLGGVLAILSVLLLIKLAKDFLKNRELSETHRIAVLLTILIYLQSAFVILVGGDWMPGLRFVVPLIIPVCYLAGLLINQWKPGIVIPFLLLAIISAPIEARYERTMGYQLLEWLRVTADGKPTTNPLKQMGLEIKQIADEEDVIALSEVGAIPYFSELPVIDMFGLVDREIAQGDGALHEIYDADIVLNRKPEFILLGLDEQNGERVALWGPDQDILAHHDFSIKYEEIKTWQRPYVDGFDTDVKNIQMVLFQRVDDSKGDIQGDGDS